MKYVSAYLLAVLGGTANPKVDDIANILGSVGVDSDNETAKLVISKLQGKTIEELISEGAAGLVSVSGGGAPAAASAAPTAGGAAPAADKPAAKKEEPKEESDDDMGFGLFD
ncbi:unnamed protein product [Caenorhabditis brenneri]